MGDRQANAGGGSALQVFAGAVIGAAGLAWWLLSEAERRRQQSSVRVASRMSPSARAPLAYGAANGTGERDLHDRVHELNQAIDDVRRQLETMDSQA